jgi:hypothetical protein
MEHFENDDDNDNDSDDVEDVSVHGSWITRRYPRRQAIRPARRETGEQVASIGSETAGLAFRSKSKKDKTPGDEHYLDPPGAEIASLALKLAKQNVRGLVAVMRHGNLINYHVVAFFEVVDANLRIFFDF